MGARSSRNTTQNNRSDGHLLEYFRNTFIRGGGGTNYVPPPVEFEIFLLAGGGGGGGTSSGYAGGGGGSGGAVYFSTYVISSPRTLSITVGGGGAGGSGGRAPNGTPSTITDPTGPYVITADGGGGGAGYAPYQIGEAGGSGGGSETPNGNYPGATGTQGSVSGSPVGSSYVLYGQPGGPITPTNYGCSGGGGLSAAGSTPVLGSAGMPTADQYRGAPGGIGITLPQFQGPDIGITPLSPYSGRYGGGGGSGSIGTTPTVYGGNSPSNPLPGNASPYGGGVGGKYNGIAGTNGVQYLGGGGGGGCPYQSSPNPATGASGGAGICIFRYPTSNNASVIASGTLATPTSGATPGNGYRYFTFTGSGSLSITL